MKNENIKLGVSGFTFSWEKILLVVEKKKKENMPFGCINNLAVLIIDNR